MTENHREPEVVEEPECERRTNSENTVLYTVYDHTCFIIHVSYRKLFSLF